ncbi:hypothetical protein [Streptacidiphilus cavernicola]|uniref:Uncharacterized protein n=1 Tax=Streptacidiphilus cavernicola TaxID=3342716 RepID=A0ABV6VTQ0_9ACTN
MLVVLVAIAIWFAIAFLLGPVVGRVLKLGHIRPTTGPVSQPPEAEAGAETEAREPEVDPEPDDRDD